MNQRKKTLAMVLAAVVLALSIAFMAGVFTNKIAPKENAITEAVVNELYTVTAENIVAFEQVPATIKAKETTLVSARILAKITTMHVRAGDYVSQGDALINLENSDLTAKVQQAKASKNAIAANLKEAQSQWQRVKELQQKGMLSQADLDKSQARKESLEANLQQAQQQLQEAEVAVAYSHIKAPISGRVVERFAQPGDTVSPGQTLLSIYNPKVMWAEANVRESLALGLQKQQKLSVLVPALNQQFSAQLEEMVPAGHTGSRSFLVKALLLENPKLMPGMFAKLVIAKGQQQQILVPEKYVAQFGQLSLVWVYQNKQLQRRFIRLGEKIQGKWQVVSGLEPGEKIAAHNTE